MNQLSPLRYPGGKSRIANFMRLVILLNDLTDGEYAEPYAGGAGVALNLLFGGYVSRIRINDCDRALASFWSVVLRETDELCHFIASVDLSVDEWHRQRAIYHDPCADALPLACATFYLNRTNRSGIIKGGGLIGGLDQSGRWKMDARFNRVELISRIQSIALRSSDIDVTCLDALDFLDTLPIGRVLCYLDPPYYHKGSELYANFYLPSDHQAVARAVHSLDCPWIVSYDNVEEIRTLYGVFQDLQYSLRYSARKRYAGKEIMFFSRGMVVPSVPIPSTACDPTQSGEPTIKAPPQIRHADVRALRAELARQQAPIVSVQL